MIYPTIHNGITEHWLFRLVAISHQSGGAVLAHFDVTQQRKTVQALADNLASFKLLFDRHPHPMWVYDRTNLQILEINVAALNRYGYTRNQFLKMKLSDLYVSPGNNLASAHISKSTIETQQRLANGDILEVSEISHAIEFGGRPAILTMSEAISDRKRLANQQILAQRMDIIGRLASGVAHDFELNLQAILNSVERSKSSCKPGSLLQEDLVSIEKAATEAALSIQQLLAFARRQALEPRNIEIGSFLANVTQVIRSIVSDGLELVTHFPEIDATIFVDPTQLSQIFTGIADFGNARSQDHGKLRISSEAKNLAVETMIGSVVVPPGDYVSFTFCDDGPSLSNEETENIFEPYYFGGTTTGISGIGLAMVYGAIKQAGGYIWVSRGKESGTCFEVYLKAVFAGSDARPNDLKIEIRALVLVVEPEPVIRSAAVKGIRSLGCQVVEAANSLEAFRTVNGSATNFAAALIDKELLQAETLDIVRILLEKSPDVKIIVLKHIDDEFTLEFEDVQVHITILNKPFKDSQLNSILSNSLRLT